MGTARRGDTCPPNVMILAPECHGFTAKVPKDEAQGLEPMAAQDELVVNEGKHEEIDAELLAADGDRHDNVDPEGMRSPLVTPQ